VDTKSIMLLFAFYKNGVQKLLAWPSSFSEPIRGRSLLLREEIDILSPELRDDASIKVLDDDRVISFLLYPFSG